MAAHTRFLSLFVSALVLGCGAERGAPVPRAEPPPAEEAAPVAAEATAGAAERELVARARAALARCEDGAAFLRLWDGLDDSERAALAASDDASVALQARWELERVAPAAGGDVPIALETAGVDRFVAFLRERAGAAPPAWWVDTLRGARFHPTTGATGYGGVPELVDRTFTREVTIAGIRLRAPSTWHVDPGEAPGAIRLTWDFADSMSYDLDAGALALELESPVVHVAAMPVGRGLILMPFEVGGGGGAEVLRRYEAGRRIWETRVCAGGRTILGGLGTEMIELVGTEELVLAFGAESHAVWVDALRIGDGALAWRYNSDLWFARHYPRRQP